MKRAHIYIDYSNTQYGMNNLIRKYMPLEVHGKGRLNYDKLFGLIEAGHVVAQRVAIGSLPRNTSQVNCIRHRGYTTMMMERLLTPEGRYVEQGVDELAHLMIANTLLDCDEAETLVMVTGDGNLSEFGTSFHAQAMRALRRGWKVIMWAWKESLSRRYEELRSEYPDLLTINLFDPHVDDLIFFAARDKIMPHGLNTGHAQSGLPETHYGMHNPALHAQAHMH